MRARARIARARGFTLIELVVVITVMGILSIGAVSFITDASDGYANTVRRTELGSTMRLAAERVTRELRNALPNSVRVSGNCLEFIPVEGGSTYLNLPVSIASTHVRCRRADRCGDDRRTNRGVSRQRRPPSTR